MTAGERQFAFTLNAVYPKHMEASLCRSCGTRHWPRQPCPAKPRSDAKNAVGSGSPIAPIQRTVASHSQSPAEEPKKRRGTFDPISYHRDYMRDYMRKRRAASGKEPAP